MKVLRFLLPGLVILAAAGLLGYQAFVTKNLETSNILKCGIIIVGALGTMLKSGKPRGSASKKAMYKAAFSDMILNAFEGDKKQEALLYRAIDDFYNNKHAASLAKLEKLRKECTKSGDIYAVNCFTGLNASRLGAYDQAVKYYSHALSIHPNSRLASNMGYCYQAAGKVPEAISAYEQAISLDRQNPNPYNNLSSLYFQEGDYEIALEFAEKAIAQKANMSQALSTAAICCALLGDHVQYELYYRRAVAAGYEGNVIKEAVQALNTSVS